VHWEIQPGLDNLAGEAHPLVHRRDQGAGGSSIITDRLSCIRGLLTRSEEIEHLHLLDGIRSVFKWYGVNRWLVGRRLVLTPLDGEFDWVELGRYGIAWPKGRPLEQLIRELVELWSPSNPHYYFAKPTEMKEGSHVVDVGASEGSFAFECLVKYGAARLWCFEPDSVMSRALRIAIERNNLTGNMEVLPAAVTGTSGDVEIQQNALDPHAYYRISDLPPADHDDVPGTTQRVNGIALDDWAEQNGIERVDYLKVDAEGGDFGVLQGARNCLMRWRPLIAVTTYHHPDHCNAIIGYLASLGLGYRFSVTGVISFNTVPRPIMVHAVVSDSTR
jgi:FkbM family methyltransferase